MTNLSSISGWAAVAGTVAALSAQAADDSWLDKAFSPVANPLFFEDPHINSEIRPIVAFHRIGDDLLGGAGLNGVSEGDARYIAVQARWAVNDRLAIIATKDGYLDVDFDNLPGLSNDGWADIALGVKYAVIKDEEAQFILTPGLKIELPTGNSDVFQGNGDGEWNLFVSGAKSWGDLRLLGSAGFRIPNDFEDETASAHYSLQLDYYTCRWFCPFITASGLTVLSEGEGLPLRIEGFDLINFGASDAAGVTQIVGGVGFRSRLTKWADFGFAYESSLTRPEGLFDDRFTLDFIFRF